MKSLLILDFVMMNVCSFATSQFSGSFGGYPGYPNFNRFMGYPSQSAPKSRSGFGGPSDFFRQPYLNTQQEQDAYGPNGPNFSSQSNFRSQSEQKQETENLLDMIIMLLIKYRESMRQETSNSNIQLENKTNPVNTMQITTMQPALSSTEQVRVKI